MPVDEVRNYILGEIAYEFEGQHADLLQEIEQKLMEAGDVKELEDMFEMMMSKLGGEKTGGEHHEMDHETMMLMAAVS
jgi:hypothetical protein